MKTLTIANAKKTVLRRVDAESTDYAQREYGATPEQMAAFADATEKRYQRLKRSGKLVTLSARQLRKL
jgi:hypothetical protein